LILPGTILSGTILSGAILMLTHVEDISTPRETREPDWGDELL